MTREEWRDVVGYEGLYQVSNMGRVCSVERDVVINNQHGTHIRHRRRKVLTPRQTPRGYLSVSLYRGKDVLQMSVHRLVMEAFVGPSDLQVNHKDEDKTNNRLDNLEYMTGRDNTRYTCCKAVESYDMQTGATIKRYESMHDAIVDGHDGGAISNVCLHKKGYLSHHGLGWRLVQ